MYIVCPFLKPAQPKLLIPFSYKFTLPTIVQKMEPTDTLQPISLRPLDLMRSVQNTCSKKNVSSNHIHPRDHLWATQRINRSEGDKRLNDDKQLFSRSLFSKVQKKAKIQKERLKDHSGYNKFDNLPISPQTQQKSTNQLNFLNTTSTELWPSFISKQQNQNTKPIFQDASYTMTDQDSLLKSPSDLLDSHQQIQKDSHQIGRMLDQKFDNLLEINFVEQGDLSADIDSKFMKRSKRKKEQLEYVQPILSIDRAALHEKLLQQENLYIRQQLITFTSIIQIERSKAQEYKCRGRALKREIHKLKSKNSVFQSQLLQREQDLHVLSAQNSQYWGEIARLKEQKGVVQGKFSNLVRQYHLILSKLQHYQEQKEKELEYVSKQKDTLIEEIKEKDKDIHYLNDVIMQLRTRIVAHQQKNKSPLAEKVNTSIDSDRILQEEDIEGEQGMRSSICLSLADAQSLKNIIQQKEQMFQQEIATLKDINIKNQLKYIKTIEQLQNNLTLLEKAKATQLQYVKINCNLKIELLKSLILQNNTEQLTKEALLNLVKFQCPTEQRAADSLRQEETEKPKVLKVNRSQSLQLTQVSNILSD